jgi:hypothetical protein
MCTGKKNEQVACWEAERAGFRFVDRAAAFDGMQLIRLRAAKRKEVLALRALHEGASSGPLRGQLRNGVGGCWEVAPRRRR